MGTARHSTADRARVRAVFRRRTHRSDHRSPNGLTGDAEKRPHAGESELPTHSQQRIGKSGTVYNHAGHKVTKGIQPDGESGRKGLHPLMFLAICARSTCTASSFTNILWPFTIAAMVLHFAFPEKQLWIFITAYIGMVPAANLIGFAGQELSRKLPIVLGQLAEVLAGSIVELIVFMVLILTPGEANIHVIQAAILGSILANLLLCLGLCFLIGGIFHPEQTFHKAVSEVGSNLMFVAIVGLSITTIYYNALSGSYDAALIEDRTQSISHATAIVLLFSFVIYVFFQLRSHHGLYEDVLRADEQNDRDRSHDLRKEKLTMTEALVAMAIGITFVSFMAVFLVSQIDYIHESRHISDAFIGLILIPIVEKASEHISAFDEAYDNTMSLALAHVLGASIQTALLNAPLVVLVGWHKGMTFNFELFDIAVLILGIIAVANFLRDEKSDYLEGSLSVIVYILIAIAAFYYPDPPSSGSEASSGSHKRAVAQILGNVLPGVA